MKIYLNVLVVIVACLMLCSCNSAVDSNTISSTEKTEETGKVEEVEEVKLTWQDGAKNELITSIFYWAYEAGTGIVDGHIGHNIDNINSRINYYNSSDFEQTEDVKLFFDEFLELYPNELENKSDKEKDLYEFYCYMNFFDEMNFDNVTELYTFGYDNNGIISDDEADGCRGLIIKDNNSIKVVVIRETSFAVKKYDEDEFVEKFETQLTKADGTMNGIYLQAGVVRNIGYRNEDINILTQYKEDNFISFLDEYSEIYSSCRSQIVKSVENDNDKFDSPSIGMVKDDVKNTLWGEPKKINKTITEYGTHEQWVFGNGRYVYVDDGVVTAIQEPTN